MLRKSITVMVLLVFIVALVGCAAHTHVVGDGGRGVQKEEARQWYILWGLVPLNDVDTNAMARGADSYTIHTEASVLDIIINIFTQWITVNSRTVTVTR